MTVTMTLPTQAQLGLVLNHIMVDYRNMAHSEDFDPNELADIADVAELIPLQFINHDEGFLRVIVVSLQDLAKKYPRANRYCSVFDMTPEEVSACVLPKDAIDWSGVNS